MVKQYELSLWSHNDEFIRLLHGQIEFDGQAYDTKYTKKANGEETLTFSIPLYIMNPETFLLEEHPAWQYIVGEQKIRLIRDKAAATMAEKDIHDFVVKNYTEQRDGDYISMNVECKAYALYELGKIGYGAIFNEGYLEDNLPAGPTNINYWMDQVLPWTKNAYSISNTTGWNYTPITLYEKSNITDYELDGNVYVPIEGPDVEKGRIIKVEKSNVFNIIQEISEKFEVWPTFTYGYDANYKVITRTISFNEEIESRAPYSIVYGTNIKSISRSIDSSSFISKMYVEIIESEFEDTGAMAISLAPQNKMMQEFLYNFDYYLQNGMLPAGFEDDYVDLQNAVRAQAIAAKIADTNAINKETELINLQAKVDFLNFEYYAVLDEIAKYESQIALMPATAVVKTDEINSISPIDGLYTIDLSRMNGVYDLGLIKTNAGVTVTATKTITYSKLDPASVEKIVFSKTNPVAPDLVVKVNYTYDPIRYFTNLKNQVISRRDALLKLISSKVPYGTLFTQLTNLKNEINGYISARTTARNTISSLINTFEEKYNQFIKEGNWRDSEYILQKSTTVIDNQPITYTNSSPFTGFIATTNPSLINFDNIHLWHNTYKYEYYRYLDYDLYWGQNSVGIKGLVFKPIIDNPASAFYPGTTKNGVATDLTSVSTLRLKYQTLETTPSLQDVALTKTTNLLYYTERKFIIADANILANSLSIVPTVGQNPLVINTDFYYVLAGDGATIYLKDTHNAKLLNNYYSITYNTNESVKFFYYDAEQVLITSSQPQVTYSCSIVDLSSLEDYEEFVPVIGQRVPIIDRELKFINTTGFINEIRFDLDNPENTDVTISNYKSRFEDLFERIMAATEQISARAEAYERVAEVITPRRVIDGDVLEQSFAENTITLAASADNSITIDKGGITLIDASNRYLVPSIVKIVGNGIFVSNSESAPGVRTWSTAITGEGINASKLTTGSIDTKLISIWNSGEPRFVWNSEGLYSYGSIVENGELKTDYNRFVRLNGEGLYFQVNTGTVDTPVIEDSLILNWDGLWIGAQSGSVQITSTYGLQVFDAQETPQERIQIGRLYNGETPLDLYGIRIKNSAGTTVFDTDSNGNLTVAGTINASAGNFTNTVNIGGAGTAGTLQVGSGTSKINIVGNTTDATTYINSGTTTATTGNGFYLGADGKIRIASATDSLTFDGTNLSITGNITATTGSIGGFTIGSTTLTSTAGNFVIDSANRKLSLGSSNSIFIADADEGIWLGNALFASAPFKVDLSGNLTATNATITGTVKATDGYIGGTTSGWDITNTGILQSSGGTSKITLDAVNAKIYIGTGTYANDNTAFYADGASQFSLGSKLTFASGVLTITGVVNASSGTIGGFTIGSTTLNSTADNFTIDSANRRITLGVDNNLFVVDGDEGIWLGNTTFADAPFSVTVAGVMKAQSGTIAGWNLSATEIYKGTGTSKIALNSGATSKFYIGVGNYNNSDTSFYVDNASNFSLGTKLYYESNNLTMSGTLVASTFKTSTNTGNGSTAGVIIDGTSARFYSASSATPLTTISTVDGTLSGTNVNLTGTISSPLFQSGVTGWQINSNGNAEFENLTARGALKSSVFIYDEINAQGGTLMIAEASVFYENTTKANNATTLTFKVKNTYLNQPYLFNVNDTLRVQTYISATSQIILWLKITTQGIRSGEYTEYTASILSSSPTTAYIIPAGSAVVKYGINNSGFITLKGDDLTYGPYLDIIVNEGTDIHLSTTQKVKTRLGKLTGITDSLFGGTLSGYGLYSQNAYLTGQLVLPNAGITNETGAVDPDDNLRIWVGKDYINRATAPLRIYQDGRMIFKDSLGNNVLELNPETGFILGPNQVITWSNISDPPTIPDSYEVIITGDHIFPGETETVLSVKIYKNGEDITSSIDGTSLTWKINETTIVSTDPTNKTLTVTEENIHQVGNISCSYVW